MDTKNELLKLIPEQGVLPLYFYKDTDVSIQVLKSLYNAGIRAVEYTNRGEAALQNFKKMRVVCDEELMGMYLGIGTIKNAAMAQTFIDAGADYITTQMFFDNKKYFDFAKRSREVGIEIPIIPGLKPITSKKQLSVLPRTFHVDIPTELSNEILKCKTDAEVEIVGTEWLLAQSKELKKTGVPVLHYYTLGKPYVIANAVKELV